MKIIYGYQTCFTTELGTQKIIPLDHITQDPKLVDVLNVGTFQFKYVLSNPEPQDSDRYRSCDSLEEAESQEKTNGCESSNSDSDFSEESVKSVNKTEKKEKITGKVKSTKLGQKIIKPVLLFNNLGLKTSMVRKMWKETRKVGNKDIDVFLLLGGERTFDILFQDFNTCYGQLLSLIKDKFWITGIDLNIFGWVPHISIAAFIKLLKRDLGKSFKITLTVPAYVLQKAHSKMSSFKYDMLINSVGSLISWYNVVPHWNFCFNTYDKIIKSGYFPSEISFCMDSVFFGSREKFKDIIRTVRKIMITYPKMCAISATDYYNAPPGPTPIRWAELMYYLVK